MNICRPTPASQTCCFTGHRTVEEYDSERIPALLEKVVEKLYGQGIRSFRCGGALGFDTEAAAAVLKLRSKVPDVRLVLVLPCRDQADRWGRRDRERYERIRVAADEVVYVAESYSRENMLRRNRALVDGSGLCISYMNTDTGGTAYTVRYAMKLDIRVVNLGSFKRNGGVI